MLSCARKQPHIFSLVLIGTCIYMNYNNFIFFKEQCPEIKDCLTKPSLMEGHQPLAQELVIRVILFAVF